MMNIGLDNSVQPFTFGYLKLEDRICSIIDIVGRLIYYKDIGVDGVGRE